MRRIQTLSIADILTTKVKRSMSVKDAETTTQGRMLRLTPSLVEETVTE